MGKIEFNKKTLLSFGINPQLHRNSVEICREIPIVVLKQYPKVVEDYLEECSSRDLYRQMIQRILEDGEDQPASVYATLLNSASRRVDRLRDQLSSTPISNVKLAKFEKELQNPSDEANDFIQTQFEM